MRVVADVDDHAAQLHRLLAMRAGEAVDAKDPREQVRPPGRAQPGLRDVRGCRGRRHHLLPPRAFAAKKHWYNV
jgi:hypothetical protein